MPERTVQLSCECPHCGQQIPTGVRFCLECGVAVNAMEKPVKRICAHCKAADIFSIAFCVACGRKLETQASVSKRKTGFSWQTDGKSAVAVLVEKPPKPASTSGISPFRIFAVISLGVLSGALAAFALSSSSVWSFALERAHWPHQGLVVYAQPPLAKVALEDEATRQITIAQVRADGSLKFKHMPAGKYRMFIEAPGYVSGFTLVQVEANRPTVIGYPVPLQLPPG